MSPCVTQVGVNAAGLTSADALTDRHQRCQLSFVSFAMGNGSPQRLGMLCIVVVLQVELVRLSWTV